MVFRYVDSAGRQATALLRQLKRSPGVHTAAMTKFRMRLIDRAGDRREWQEDVEGERVVASVLDPEGRVVWEQPLSQWAGYEELSCDTD